MDGDRIAYLATNDKKQEAVYVTGNMDDPNLVTQLTDAGVSFGRVITDKNSPILNFFLNWILPIGIFIALGQLLSRYMMNRMGGLGNAMTFGKSNAKVYVQAQTGKTFADVAGCDEAKESLTEIVDFLYSPEKYKQIGALHCAYRQN